MIDRLLAMDDDAFAALVGRDLRRDTDPATHTALRTPEIIERFYAHLTAINRKCELDLQYRRLECEAADDRLEHLRGHLSNVADVAEAEWQAAALWAAYDKWRPGVVRFKSGVEVELSLAKVAYDKVVRDRIDPQMVKMLKRRVTHLEAAIHRHRSALKPDPRPADEELWTSVDS